LQRHLRRAIDDNDDTIAAPLICELANYAPAEALDDIREAFERGIVDESIVGLDGVERSIAQGEAGLQDALERCLPTGIPDTIEELREWATFREEPAGRPEARHVPPLDTQHLPPSPYAAQLVEPIEPLAETIVSREPRIGRNDPCPCGSGKKFKKCCGARN
jgi:hypothetical protein